MFDIFGEFDSSAEINMTATNLRREGDNESIKALAKENGIDEDIAQAFIEGDLFMLADPMAAALGKIEIESKELQPKEIMEDWVEYIKTRCFEDEAVAIAVRKKGKSLKGCIAALLKWSFNNQIPVDNEIIKAAGVTGARVAIGIPGMGRAKQIMTEYYTRG